MTENDSRNIIPWTLFSRAIAKWFRQFPKTSVPSIFGNATVNIMVLGATGFIGRWITQTLVDSGYNLYGAVKNCERLKKQFPTVQPIACDFLKDTQLKDWLNRLENIDIIINCVGIFYHPKRSILWKIHYHTPLAIYNAAKRQKVRKIIHISALGIEKYDNAYSQSKKAIEVALTQLAIPYIILKPSFVYGPGARGSTALLKTLAALPAIIPLPGEGSQSFQPIHVSDLAKAVKALLPMEQNSQILAAVSQQSISVKEVLIRIRQWLGLKEAKCFAIPLRWIKTFAFIGNFFSKSLINSQAINMLELGNKATEEETKAFLLSTKISPANFNEGIARIPASEEDYWHAKLSWLGPLLRLSLAFMWLFSGLTSAFWFDKQHSFQFLAQVGIPENWQPWFLYGASALDILIGLTLLFNYKTKENCLLQIVVMAIYTAIISVFLPQLWLDPFGPIVKNLPLALSIFILYSLEPRS